MNGCCSENRQALLEFSSLCVPLVCPACYGAAHLFQWNGRYVGADGHPCLKSPCRFPWPKTEKKQNPNLALHCGQLIDTEAVRAMGQLRRGIYKITADSPAGGFSTPVVSATDLERTFFFVSLPRYLSLFVSSSTTKPQHSFRSRATINRKR